MAHLYASFADASLAEKAAGACSITESVRKTSVWSPMTTTARRATSYGTD